MLSLDSEQIAHDQQSNNFHVQCQSHISVEVCLQAFTCQTEVQHFFLIGGKGSVYKTCSVVNKVLHKVWVT
jgi:hypothetical protein